MVRDTHAEYALADGSTLRAPNNGECHVETVAALQKIAAEGTAEIGSDSDRDWFASHPGENYRVRFLGPGEELLLGPKPKYEHCLVAVRQFAPGVRSRLGLNVPTLPPVFTPEIARRAWEWARALSGAANGDTLLARLEKKYGR